MSQIYLKSLSFVSTAGYSQDAFRESTQAVHNRRLNPAYSDCNKLWHLSQLFLDKPIMIVLTREEDI